MKLIILDRDGTINADRDDYVKSVDEWQPLPGALEAIARLNQAGWHVVVATNQSGLGRGLFSAATLNAMHAKMHRLLAAVGGKVDAVFYCPHVPDDNCACRKPAAGLFMQIIERYALDPAGTQIHTAGDTARDLQAGVQAGCVPHLVLTGKSEALRGQLAPGQMPQGMSEGLPEGMPEGTRVHQDLAAFAEHVMSLSA
jgi:D-glycero-D-manno-heptose 1,7-bisphosphate phosphatase